jgi:hypothetical protein
LATEFEKKIRTVNQRQGWGQFLDGTIGHQQVGPYGTAAGAIVRSLAGRQRDAVGVAVETSLASWCTDTDADCSVLWPQTLRLAFLHLALQASAGDAEFTRRLGDELQARCLKGGLWGDYWCGPGPSEHDPTPKVVPSAVVLLSFGLFGDGAPHTEGLTKQAKLLEKRVEEDVRLSMFDLAIAAAAVLSITKKPLTKKADRRLRQLALDLPRNLAELGVYFYEYRRLPMEGGQAEYPRDYFIVPVAIIAAIAGLLPAAPSILRYRAYEIAEMLAGELEAGDGLYRPSPDSRVATKNQAWVAMLLASLDRAKGRPRFASLRLLFFRPRTDNTFTAVVVPMVAWATAIAAQFVPASGIIGRVSLATVALVVLGLYPPNKILPRLVRRKEW